MANIRFEFSTNMEHPTPGDTSGSEVWTNAPGFIRAVLHWPLGHTPGWIDCYFHAAESRQFPWVRVRATDENGAIGIWRFDDIEEQFEGGSRQWRARGRDVLYGAVDNYLRSPRIKAEEDPDNDDDPGYTEWPIIPPQSLITLEELEDLYEPEDFRVVNSKLVITEEGCGTVDDPCTLDDFEAHGFSIVHCVFDRNSDRDDFLVNNFAESRFNQEPSKLGPNYTRKGVRRGWVFKDIMRHSAGSYDSASRPILAVYNRSLTNPIADEGNAIGSNFQQSQSPGAGANALAYDVAISWLWIDADTPDSGYDYRTVWPGKVDTYAPSGQAVEIKQRGQFEWDDDQCFGPPSSLVPEEPFIPVPTVELVATFRFAYIHKWYVAAKAAGPGVVLFICSGLSIGRRCDAKSRPSKLVSSGTLFYQGYDWVTTTDIPTYTATVGLADPIPLKWANGSLSVHQCTGELFREGWGDTGATPLPDPPETRCGPQWDYKEVDTTMEIHLGNDLGSGFKLITHTSCEEGNTPPGVILRDVFYYVAKDAGISQPTLPDDTVPCNPTNAKIIEIFESYFENSDQLFTESTTTPSTFVPCDNAIIGFEVSVNAQDVYSRARAFGMGLNNAGGQFTASLPGSEDVWNPSQNQFKVRRELLVNDYGINEGPELLNLAQAYIPLPEKELGGFTILKIWLAGIPRAGSTAPFPNKIIQAADRLQIGAGMPSVDAGAWIVDEAEYESPKGISTFTLSQRPAAQTRALLSGNIRNLGESLAALGGVYESKWFSVFDEEFLVDPDVADPSKFYDTFQFQHYLGVIPRTIVVVAAKQKIFDWYDDAVVSAAQPLYVPESFIDLSQVQGVGYDRIVTDDTRIVFHFWRYLFYDDLDGTWVLPQDRFLKVWIMA